MQNTSVHWQLFIVSLPTNSATVRMRIWRTLKSLGCAALRDGAYLLPASASQTALRDLSEETVREGGTAWLLSVQPQSSEEDLTYRVLFDRSADYADWLTMLANGRTSLPTSNAQEINRTMRKLRRDYETISGIDFFPNEASTQAEAAWKDFVHAVDALLSPDEPHAVTAPISRLDIKNYQGRTWATRRRMWVDRVASAWLIRRFIDKEARFLWLASPTDCPSDALGFDFDGAAFTHVGERVSFEVLLASFGLDQDRGLIRLGAMVHALDLGNGFVPEASGFEAILTGARERAADDDQFLAEIGSVLDALYLHFSNDSPTKK